MLRIELLSWREAGPDASRVRFAVFVDEQQVPAQMELDENDDASLHALARHDDGTPVGTGRLLPDGRIGRMAVLRDWRGQGIGAELLARLVDAARERGDSQVFLSSQVRAIDFYRRYGFTEEGPVYDDAGIPHGDMRLVLRQKP